MPTPIHDRILFHLADGTRELLEPEDVYLLHTDGDDTLVRLRRAEPLLDPLPPGAPSGRG